MPSVLISGGTGLIGTRLSERLLAKGYDVMILTRNPDQHHNVPGIRYVLWDVDKGTIDAKAVGDADHIIHLAGAGIAEKRWTDKRKQQIVNSRTQSSALLVKALKEIPNHIQTVVSASASGWYGEDTAGSYKNGFTEEAPADNGFLGETCKQWEASIAPVTAMGKRLVIIRTGIVFSEKGGALQQLARPVKFGFAPIISKGEQHMSWIHIDDICRLYIAAIENENMQGPYNAAAGTVTNKGLMLQLAQHLKGKFYLPVHVPGFFIKLFLGEMGTELLKSLTMNNNKIKKAGFICMYPALSEALQALYPPKN